MLYLYLRHCGLGCPFASWVWVERWVCVWMWCWVKCEFVHVCVCIYVIVVTVVLCVFEPRILDVGAEKSASVLPADFFGAPDILQLDEWSCRLVDCGSDVCLHATMPVSNTTWVCACLCVCVCVRLLLLPGSLVNCVDLEGLSLPFMDVEAYLWWGVCVCVCVRVFASTLILQEIAVDCDIASKVVGEVKVIQLCHVVSVHCRLCDS